MKATDETKRKEQMERENACINLILLKHFYNSLLLHGMKKDECPDNWLDAFLMLLIVIICGSATSWITDNLINNHGGLYNRLTYEMKLSPFTLRECEQYFASEGITFSQELNSLIESDFIVKYVPFGYSKKMEHYKLVDPF